MTEMCKIRHMIGMREMRNVVLRLSTMRRWCAIGALCVMVCGLGVLPLASAKKALGGVAIQGLGVALGPPGVGLGGTNPIMFRPYDYQVHVIFPESELVVSLVPGIIYSRRYQHHDWFFSFGGGVIQDVSGLGVGVATGFGYEFFCFGLCIGAEYRQALGFNALLPVHKKNNDLWPWYVQFPYVLRIYATYVF